MKRFITEKELSELFKTGKTTFVFPVNSKFTPAAKDFINNYKLEISFENKSNSTITEFPEKIIIGSDHTGYKAKIEVIKFLKSKGYLIEDAGTNSEDACDYPDFAFKVANAVKNKMFHRGIVIDATGIPSSICANKVKGILSAVAINEFSVKSSREHNNSNVLTIGARIFSSEYIINLIDLWLNTKFSGERHQKRLDKIFSSEQ